MRNVTNEIHYPEHKIRKDANDLYVRALLEIDPSSISLMTWYRVGGPVAPMSRPWFRKGLVWNW